jgi:hypothetical protein
LISVFMRMAGEDRSAILPVGTPINPAVQRADGGLATDVENAAAWPLALF